MRILKGPDPGKQVLKAMLENETKCLCETPCLRESYLHTKYEDGNLISFEEKGTCKVCRQTWPDRQTKVKQCIPDISMREHLKNADAIFSLLVFHGLADPEY